ncbi:MAG: YbaN family protein [Acidimicrobiales bacterium]|nr:YbaN family protein [Acidimicrobiales bacterium]
MILRGLWLVLGLACVGLGGIGVVVPGLPTTVFFICAAACFTRSSPRLEAWVLDLPGIGPMVRDYRAGLGMPRRAKRFAVASIVVFAGLAVLLALDGWLTRATVAVAALIGIAVILLRIPTRERVEQ